MRGTAPVRTRADRLEGAHGQARARRLVVAIAADLGIDPSELKAEAEAMRRECVRLGLRTEREQMAHIAERDGIPLAELEAELAAVKAAFP